jgi:hypothetical protein
MCGTGVVDTVGGGGGGGIGTVGTAMGGAITGASGSRICASVSILDPISVTAVTTPRKARPGMAERFKCKSPLIDRRAQ